MQHADILRLRLQNQRLAGQQFKDLVEAVQWFGGVQAQDFAGASWAVSQRTEGANASDFSTAFAQGHILRTHVMRPTWHFVVAEDIRWMLDLTRARVLQAISYYYRQFELDEQTVAKTDDIIQQALEGGKHKTRAELAAVLARHGFSVEDGVRLAHIIGHAEIVGLICSGIPQGKQQTYALLQERAPKAKILNHDAAISELAKRYFKSHGPATFEDYMWWSGLTAQEARAGLESVQNELKHEDVAGKRYWFVPSTTDATTYAKAYLLPNYDEYVVAYADREALFDSKLTELLDSRRNPVFNNVLILDGVIAGTWARTMQRASVTVTIKTFHALSGKQRAFIQDAAEQYAAYLGANLVLKEA